MGFLPLNEKYRSWASKHIARLPLGKGLRGTSQKFGAKFAKLCDSSLRCMCVCHPRCESRDFRALDGTKASELGSAMWIAEKRPAAKGV